MGDDHRPFEAIIEADTAVLSGLGHTKSDVAVRMKDITRRARAGLGTTVSISRNLEATIIEARGRVPCPWPHPGRYGKNVVVARRTDTGETVRWSELGVHMVASHGFMEGRGSYFRLDPEALVRVIFADV